MDTWMYKSKMKLVMELICTYNNLGWALPGLGVQGDGLPG